MKCYNHYEVESQGVCQKCGRAICKECVSEKPPMIKMRKGDLLYCSDESCLKSMNKSVISRHVLEGILVGYFVMSINTYGYEFGLYELLGLGLKTGLLILAYKMLSNI